MNVKLKLQQNLWVEFETEQTQAEIFKTLSSVQEVFGQEACGKCKKDDLRFIVRTVDDNAYHEIRCQNCGAKLAFGANKKGGGLFPKRTEKNEDTGETSWLPDGGWMKWDREKKKNI